MIRMTPGTLGGGAPPAGSLPLWEFRARQIPLESQTKRTPKDPTLVPQHPPPRPPGGKGPGYPVQTQR